MHDRLIELLELDNCSQMNKEEYEEMLTLLAEAKERAYILLDSIE